MIFAVFCFPREKKKWNIDVPDHLEFLEIPGGVQSTAIVLLHGYGANGHDLYPLPQALRISRDVHWYFPHAPLSCPSAGYQGRMWFPIDEIAFESATGSGEMERISLEFSDSVRLIDQFIHGIAGKHSQIILGGFSQGSMVSFHVAFNRIDVRKLLMFSGILVGDSNSFEKKEFSVFQSHGRNDSILPFLQALKLKEFFEKRKMDLNFVEFHGGHEIPLDVIGKLRSFLENQDE